MMKLVTFTSYVYFNPTCKLLIFLACLLTDTAGAEVPNTFPDLNRRICFIPSAIRTAGLDLNFLQNDILHAQTTQPFAVELCLHLTDVLLCAVFFQLTTLTLRLFDLHAKLMLTT